VIVLLSRQLFVQAEEALNTSIRAEERISGVETTLEGVASDISQTRANVAEAADALSSAENKCKTRH